MPSLCPYCKCKEISIKRTYCSDSCSRDARRWKKRLSAARHKEKNVARAVTWQKVNRERRKEIQNAYYARHREEIAGKMKERIKLPKVVQQRKKAQKRFYQLHREEILAQQKTSEWKEKHRIYDQNYKARNKDKVREWNTQAKNRRKFGGNRFIALERDAYTCRDCKTKAKDVHHLDGSGQTKHPNNDLLNLIVLCRSCHAIRHLKENRFKRIGKCPERKKILKTAKYQAWRKAVFERDNYTCQFCKKRGCYLEADHIKVFALYPKLRTVVSNGRTLCRPCHMKRSTKNGRRHPILKTRFQLRKHINKVLE